MKPRSIPVPAPEPVKQVDFGQMMRALAQSRAKPT